MNAAKIPTVKIGYPKHWFVIGTLIYAVVTVLLFYLAIAAVDGFTKGFWFVVSSLEGVLMFLFLVPPILTNHLAGAKAMRLKMGLLVNASIPYEWIKEVKQTSIPWGSVRVGIGVRYSPIPRILFITSSFTGLVRIVLDKEHDIGRIWKRPVSEIVLSVGYMPGAIDIIKDRAGLAKGEA